MSSTFTQKKAEGHTTPAPLEDGAARGSSVQLKRSVAGMDYASGAAAMAPVQMDGGGAKPAPVAPSPEQIVQDAYTLGGESRYQVTPEQAMQWIEQRMDHVPPEHRYAWQQARLRVNKRL